MKTRIKILKSGLIILALVLMTPMGISCSKDDPAPEPIAKPDPKPDPVTNNAPGAFDLIGVTNGATKVDVLPTFSWQAATDPDGAPVTYDLLLDTQMEPAIVLASDLTGTTYTPTDRLHLTTLYFWNVVAKDGKGGKTTSATNNFTTRGLNFQTAPVTAAAFPKGISGHASTVFQDYLWVIGGRLEGGGLSNKVWYSSNGSNWFDFLSLVPFTPREGHTIAVFDNKLWVIGGNDGTSKNDVWYSEDGAFWVEATTASTKFSPRSNHTTAVFDNKLWVIGGYNKDNISDIWYSSDGINWIQTTVPPPYSARGEHTTVVFDNKLWIIGGYAGNYYSNDVWYSSDGATWTQTTKKVDFGGRVGHTTVVFDDKLWVFGGDDGGVGFEVWYSSGGETWSLSTPSAPFGRRQGHTTTVFNNKLWVIGGNGSVKRYNDVWAFD